MTYIEAGEYYNYDGDLVDGRDDLVKELRREVVAFRLRDKHEANLRDNNKGLREAWEKYQIILGLVDNADG